MNVPELVSILRGYPSALADWETHDEEICGGVFDGDIGPNGEYWPESPRRRDAAIEHWAQLRGAVAYHRDCLAQLARLTGKVLTLETGFPRTGGPPDEFQNALNDALKNWTEANSEPTKSVEQQAATLAGGDAEMWITGVELERLTVVNRGTIKRAADRGEIETNGKVGNDKRYHLASFHQWHKKRANQDG